MEGRKALASAIDELAGLLAELGNLVDFKLDEHRAEIVRMRRAVAEQHAEVHRLAEDTFAGASELKAYREAHSALRSAMAQHQAKWSVVSICPESSEYRSSVRTIRMANRTFIEWLRVALRAGRDPGA